MRASSSGAVFSALAAVLTIQVCPVSATTLRVPSQYPTIQAGIGAAAVGDIVLVSPGEYHEHIVIPFAMTLRGEAGAGVTILDGDSSGQILRVLDGTIFEWTVVEGFTFRNGSTEHQGGAIRVDNTFLRVSECVFLDNRASDRGGAIFAWYARWVVLENNEFLRNQAREGGAAYYGGTGGDITGNSIRECTADQNGGGLALYAATPTVRANVIQDNVAGLRGGGLSIYHPNRLSKTMTFEGTQRRRVAVSPFWSRTTRRRGFYGIDCGRIMQPTTAEAFSCGASRPR